MKKIEKPIKAMIYTNLMHDGRVLYNSKYKGYEYYVVSYGTHPCCYIALNKSNRYYNKGYDDIPLDVHGGLTYSDFNNFLSDKQDWIIGWDYAHVGDRYGSHYRNGHTWKTTELIRECIKAIDKLEEMI